MRCLTKIESEEWFSANSFNSEASPSDEIFVIRAKIPQPFGRTFWLSQVLSKSFIDFDNCLLWVTTWGVWRSSENFHLFYKLRETYGERRLISEVPGHLFQKYEQSDLATFIQVTLLFGWDFHLRPSPAWIQGFVSHDGWFELFATSETNLEDVKATFEQGKIDFKIFKTKFSEYRFK
jgi:hypothetical protein